MEWPSSVYCSRVGSTTTYIMYITRLNYIPPGAHTVIRQKELRMSIILMLPKNGGFFAIVQYCGYVTGVKNYPKKCPFYPSLFCLECLSKRILLMLIEIVLDSSD